MIEARVYNPHNFKKISPEFLRNTAKKILGAENKFRGLVSIVLVSPKKARELNTRYLRKNYVPEVLSFEAAHETELGELILCPQAIRHKAKDKKTSFEKELVFCLIHGLLHILGYGHLEKKEAKIMQAKEREYLNKFLKGGLNP